MKFRTISVGGGAQNPGPTPSAAPPSLPPPTREVAAGEGAAKQDPVELAESSSPPPTVNGHAHPVTLAVREETPLEDEGALELPPRTALTLTGDEIQHVRSIATSTVSRLMALKRIGNAGAGEQLQDWIESTGWNSPQRDLLVTQLDLRSASLLEDVEGIGSKVQAKTRDIPCCDFSDHLSVEFSKLPKAIQRLLQISSCVPIYHNAEGAALIIGSINAIAAVQTADAIDKLQLSDCPTPFVTPMRLQWNAWVKRLSLYGI